MAEMAARAHEISLEAGSKMAAAMRDVVGAAAGISAFAIESARDLVNYMVRRGQMSQDEATRLMNDVEEAHAKLDRSEVSGKESPSKPARPDSQSPRTPPQPVVAKPPVARDPDTPPKEAVSPAKQAAQSAPAKASKPSTPPVRKAASSKPAARSAETKTAAKATQKPAAKTKAVARKPAPRRSK